MFKVFHGDSALLFAEVPGAGKTIPFGESLANIVENLEKYKLCTVVSDDPRQEFGRFLGHFRRVDAAGGVVTGPGDSLLMILRSGRWDLPKGHMEDGEEPVECAVREVAEETGVTARYDPARPAETQTWHFYLLDGKWVIKRTYWFDLYSPEAGDTLPQTEEGITRVEWVPRGDVVGKAADCFPSVREVLAGHGWLNGK